MRILLTSSAPHLPPRGGSTRSNLAWLAVLASRGHACRIVAPAASLATPEQAARVREELEQQGFRPVLAGREDKPGVEVFQHGAITVCSVRDPGRVRAVLREQVAEFEPTWVLVSSEDLGQVLLQEAQRSAPGRVIYLAHTPQAFPFGPYSLNPNPAGAELVARAAGIVAIGNTMADYIERYLGRRPVVIHPPVYGPGPHPRRDPDEDGLITMVNPCAVKGISIFLALARRFPGYRFGALRGWGTTAEDLQELERLANVTLLPKVKEIATILERTKILLAPSLWPEGFGLIVMEAMLHGVPVLASDQGGLVEAKAGTRYVVPVRPIERYRTLFDENRLPLAVVPEQDIEPWARALEELMSDRELYRREAEAARAAAEKFVAGVRPEALEEFLAALEPGAGLAAAPRPGPDSKRPLRILLAQNTHYFPAFGGGDKSNRLLLEALAARGHVCRVVARRPAALESEYLEVLAARGVTGAVAQPGVVRFALRGVEVDVSIQPDARPLLKQVIGAFAPDVVLLSTDDPAQLLLETALGAGRARIVYLVRTTLSLPFGPEAAFPSEERTERLRRVDAVVTVSRYVADYVRRWGGIEATALPISLLEPGPRTVLGRFENEFVTMVNPCAVKGISIFLALADALPEVRFAAVPTWGATTADLEALRRRPNVTILPPADDIARILERTRVMLVPSLWAEARGRIVVEAMLHGVPVLASNVGGLPEAMMGMDYLLPVRPIERYQRLVDEKLVPVAEVPEQDIAPWRSALEQLVNDPERYAALARASRQAALAYAAGLSIEPFERLLRDVSARPQRTIGERARAEGVSSRTLSPEKRALLAALLKRTRTPAQAAERWFPFLKQQAGARLRLFCFPYAGGGTAVFRTWAGRLPAWIGVCPARLPGRESRLAETGFDRVEPLVEALAEVLEQHLDQPYALFGHSLGALVAFELARRLEHEGRPRPIALLPASARAPQFRLQPLTDAEPDEEAFVEELRRLGGRAELLESEELRKLTLPALRADCALARRYCYQPGPPLEVPIRAYMGAGDARLDRAAVEAWRKQTRSTFRLRLFSGGHFFLHDSETEFLRALGEDLTELMG